MHRLRVQLDLDMRTIETRDRYDSCERSLLLSQLECADYEPNFAPTCGYFERVADSKVVCSSSPHIRSEYTNELQK
jgi:hypothetical protein